MLRVGIAGIGFMGMIHYLAWQKVKGAKVVAIATRDERKRAGDWTSIQGNFGPRGQQMDLGKVSKYQDAEELAADPKIDLVDLCLPPDLHAQASIAALKAGKHVLCEKPIAVSAKDAARMVKAADAAKRQLLIAHVLPFVGEFGFAYRTISSGKYGRVLGATLKRVIADPLWLENFYDPDRVGGPMVDLHIHDAHFIRLVCGMPQAVFTSGRMRGAVAEFFTSQFMFASDKHEPPTVTAISGVLRQQGRSFTHGFEIQLERATLLFDFAVVDGQPKVNIPLTILTSDGKVLHPELPSGDPVDDFVRELSSAVKSLRSGKVDPVLDGRLASDALLLCEKQTQSLRTGRIVRV